MHKENQTDYLLKWPYVVTFREMVVGSPYSMFRLGFLPITDLIVVFLIF